MCWPSPPTATRHDARASSTETPLRSHAEVASSFSGAWPFTPTAHALSSLLSACCKLAGNAFGSYSIVTGDG